VLILKDKFNMGIRWSIRKQTFISNY